MADLPRIASNLIDQDSISAAHGRIDGSQYMPFPVSGIMVTGEFRIGFTNCTPGTLSVCLARLNG